MFQIAVAVAIGVTVAGLFIHWVVLPVIKGTPLFPPLFPDRLQAERTRVTGEIEHLHEERSLNRLKEEAEALKSRK